MTTTAKSERAPKTRRDKRPVTSRRLTATALIALLCLLGVIATPVLAQESFTADGITYEKVQWGTVTATTVSFRHNGGAATLLLSKLPPELQRRFGYDPKKAAELGTTGGMAKQQSAIPKPTRNPSPLVWSCSEKFKGSVSNTSSLKPVLRLRVEQNYGPGTTKAPADEIRDMLLNAGVEIKEEGSRDAALEIEITGRALSQKYSMFGLGEGTEYFTGASITGTILLEAPNERMIQKKFEGRVYPPSSLKGWGGPTSHAHAPFLEAFKQSDFPDKLGEAIETAFGPWVAARYWIALLKRSDLRVYERPAFERIGVPAVDVVVCKLRTRDIALDQASRIVGWVGNAAAEPLIAGLKDKDAKVRAWSADLLETIAGGIGKSQPTAILIELLKEDKDAEVRASAAHCLRRMGPVALEPLIEALKDQDARVRMAATEAIGYRRWAAQAIAHLLRALKEDKDAGVRAITAKTLATIGQEAVEPLIQSLKDSDADVRKAALEALGSMGEPKAVEALLDILKSDADMSLRNAAVEALRNIKDRRAVGALITAMQDQPISVRNIIYENLAKITGQDFGLDYQAWAKWWESNPAVVFAPTGTATNPAEVKTPVPQSPNQDSSARRTPGITTQRFGEIVSITTDRITVKSKTGDVTVINITAETKFGSKAAPKTISDFKAGDQVLVVYKQEGTRYIASAIVPPPPSRRH